MTERRIPPEANDERRASDWMTRRVVTVEATDTVERAATLMRDRGVGCLPVRRNAGLVGMLTDRDLALRVDAEGRSPASTAVEQVMTPRIWFVNRDTPLSEAARLMCRERLHRVAVLDGDLLLVGILSLEDLPADLLALATARG